MKATKQKMRQIENGKLSREKRMHDWKRGLKVRFAILFDEKQQKIKQYIDILSSN